jgi:hypothetical protein
MYRVYFEFLTWLDLTEVLTFISQNLGFKRASSDSPVSPCISWHNNTKAELPEEGILFRTQFPSLGIFINKKVGFRKI